MTKNYRNLFFLIITLLFNSPLFCEKIGLLIVATGNYHHFVPPLITSARQFFCPNHEVTFFIFTDQNIAADCDTVIIPQKKLGWPYDTLMRTAMYHQATALLSDLDYIFACDADMLFVDYVGDEILSERVATQHPGFVGRRGTYERNAQSKAAVRNHEGECYFAGGFYGGSRPEFFMLIDQISKAIDDDLARNIIALWHDESHLNRYFIDHKPTKILDPSYCYPESWKLPYVKRLLALDKNHAQMRA